MISCVISAAALKLKQIHVLLYNFMHTMGTAVTAQQVVREQGFKSCGELVLAISWT